MKRAYGFTIIELLIVIVVISILVFVSTVVYSNMSVRARDTIAVSDLRSNLRRVELFYAQYDRLPSTVDLATSPSGDDHKIKISKRSVYTFYGYCTGALNGKREIIITAGTTDQKQFYISSDKKQVVDVSEDYALPSQRAGEYKCFDYLLPGSATGEFRNMIHRNGGVEGGYITVLSQ